MRPTRPIRARGEVILEYLRGALWVLPMVSVVLALLAGTLLSRVHVGTDSWLHALAFQGSADDARQLLTAIAATMVTVIALVLGLTIVALQVASTQFSPRLLRNFLRDRPNQLVLSVFVATFAYSTAGLYTVGIRGGDNAEDFPRIAVTGAIVLVFVSLAMLVYFVHHVAHSIRIDSVMTTVARNTLRQLPPDGSTAAPVRPPASPASPATAPTAPTATPPAPPPADRIGPRPPPGALVLTAPHSGYLQTVHPRRLLDEAVRQDAVVVLLARVGDHLVAGPSPFALAWARTDAPAGTAGRTGPAVAPADPDALRHALARSVQIGSERTLQQDAAFGIRQLVDIALRTLSAAINDPYSAVQLTERLTPVICRLATLPLGDTPWPDAHGVLRVSTAGHRFGEHLDLACAQIRRYGSAEPAVSQALLKLLGAAAALVPPDGTRRAQIAEQARLVLLDSEARVRQPADLVPVRDLAARLGLP